jgi:poly(beta-D-mannuronate) lyase
MQRAYYYRYLLLFICVSSMSALVNSVAAKEWKVKSLGEYKEALKAVKPGDDIVLANGNWQNVEILFKALGREDALITLRAETPGKVILSGQSNLRLAGEYLVVSGLVFKDGYTPSAEVISFRQNKDDLANHSRVTQVVIDNYNNPEKFEQDSWVMMFGKNNRFDHNHLVGKRNAGVTMAVRLTSEASQQNNHRIDHNYFGPRPILGSNGGETLRIGTSHYSLSDSLTLIESNYFDRCNGEVEIISNKSGHNVIRNNVFFESRGTLTLRHGSGNLVEGNVFFGNGVDHTGGIRVINSDQIVRNNYLEGLTGYRFGSGLTVMNGVPDSKINRYHQVNNALIENNTLVDVAHIQLAAGSDQERSAVPINSVLQNNLISNNSGSDGIDIFDDISGIRFVNNVVSEHINPTIKQGFAPRALNMQRAANGLLYPADKKGLGASQGLQPIQKSQVGVSWYAKVEPDTAFDSGNTITVLPGDNSLFDAIELAHSGDVLLLSEGSYNVTKVIKLHKTLTLKAAKKGSAKIYPGRSTFVDIENGGNLKLVGLHISGKDAPDAAGNTLLRTSKFPMLTNFRLVIENSKFEDLNINHSYHFFDAGSRSFADNITITDSTFSHISGDILKLNKETDDLGIYNAEYVNLSNNRFKNIDGALINLYRGGTDESTFGPHFTFSNNVVDNSGIGQRNKSSHLIDLHGVQVTRISQNQFNHSAAIHVEHTVGEPITEIIDNIFTASPAPTVNELVALGTDTAVLNNNKVLP